MESEENSEVAKVFSAGHPSFKLETELELLPFARGVDGAYVTKLKQAESLLTAKFKALPISPDRIALIDFMRLCR